LGTFETGKLKDFSKENISKIVRHDASELANMDAKDIMSVWCFFKFACSQFDAEPGEPVVFVTMEDTIVYKNKDMLEKNWGMNIMSMGEFMKNGKAKDSE